MRRRGRLASVQGAVRLWPAVVAGGCGLALGATVARAAGVAGLVVVGVFVALGLGAAVSALGGRADVATRRMIAGWTAFAFGLHLAAGLFIWAIPRLTGYFGGDALTYHAGALALAQHWQNGGPMPALPAGKGGFFYLLAALYVVFGPHAEVGLALDAGFAAAVVPVLWEATARLFGQNAARFVPPLATLMPGFVVWGSQLLREPGVYLFLAVALSAAVRLSQRPGPASIAVLALSAALAVSWRADVGLLVVAGLIVGLVLASRATAAGALSGASVAAVLLAIVVGVGLGARGYHLVTHANLAELNTIRTGSATEAASGFLRHANIATPGHALAYLPLGLVYFLLGPFPWQLHGGRELWAIPDVLVWWALLPSLWRGLRAGWRRLGLRGMLPVFPAAALAVVLTLLIANFGTAVRERMQVILLLLPLVALGLAEREARRARPAARGAPLGPGDRAVEGARIDG